jgi:hypothetical protein
MRTLTGGPAMIQQHEPAILEVTIMTLQDAVRRVAARLLEAPGALEVIHFRRVERLMRLAVALAGAGGGAPLVEFHGLPPAGPGALPEILAVKLTDLLAARAAEHLPAALEGDPEALRAFEREAERLLETDDIQRLVQDQPNSRGGFGDARTLGVLPTDPVGHVHALAADLLGPRC